jgi:hypothetical protein
VLLCNISYSQISGIYIGVYNRTYKVDTSTTTSQKTAYPNWDGQKKIVLKRNKQFMFENWELGQPCAARDTKRFCSGKYRLNRDTLFLTSKYKQSDFFGVFEGKIDTLKKGRVIIVTKYQTRHSPETFINGFTLQINKKAIDNLKVFAVNDSIICNVSGIEDILISSSSPYRMEWNYSPQNKDSNFFLLILSRQIESQNIYLENCKMLIRKDRLILLGNETLEVRDNIFEKK